MQKYSKKWDDFVDAKLCDIVANDIITVTPVNIKVEGKSSKVDTSINIHFTLPGLRSIFLPQEPSKEAVKILSVCEKVKRPPKEHKTIPRKLFPNSSSPASSPSSSSSSASSSASSESRPVPAFDPSEDCIFVKEQKAKKKATKNASTPRLKLTNITLMVIQDVKKGVPRGAHKDSLIKKGMAMRIKFHREMSESEVHIKMKKVLQPYFPDYTILDCEGIKFVPRHKQPSGAELIETAMKRRGNMIYVTKKVIERDSPEVSFFSLGAIVVSLP